MDKHNHKPCRIKFKLGAPMKNQIQKLIKFQKCSYFVRKIQIFIAHKKVLKVYIMRLKRYERHICPVMLLNFISILQIL